MVCVCVQKCLKVTRERERGGGVGEKERQADRQTDRHRETALKQKHFCFTKIVVEVQSNLS